MTKLLNNTLYIVSTPIGNLDDITLRAIQVLKSSDIILCEDTRHSLKLLNHLNIKKKLISYHKFNEKKQIPNIIEYINQGKILSLISDAGTPMLSDPGKHLINACLKNKIKITPIPGVSSVTASISVAGFEDKFLFYGFLPKRDKELEKVLTKLSNLNYSQVFFIPALKINFYLNKFKIFFNDRKIMIAKEVTKIHEFFYREDVKNISIFKKPLKGELTVVISEKNLKINKVDNVDLIINKAKKYLKKYSLKDTVELISNLEDINKKKVYDICLKIKNEENN